jgi:nucleoredoxin
MSFTPTLL